MEESKLGSLYLETVSQLIRSTEEEIESHKEQLEKLKKIAYVLEAKYGQ